MDSVSRKGGPGELRKGDVLGVCSHTQGAVQMPVAWPGCKKAMVGTRWTNSHLVA